MSPCTAAPDLPRGRYCPPPSLLPPGCSWRLVTSQPVSPGELLLICPPLALVRGPPGSLPHPTALLAALAQSELTPHQLSALAMLSTRSGPGGSSGSSGSSSSHGSSSGGGRRGPAVAAVADPPAVLAHWGFMTGPDPDPDRGNKGGEEEGEEEEEEEEETGAGSGLEGEESWVEEGLRMEDWVAESKRREAAAAGRRGGGDEEEEVDWEAVLRGTDTRFSDPPRTQRRRQMRRDSGGGAQGRGRGGGGLEHQQGPNPIPVPAREGAGGGLARPAGVVGADVEAMEGARVQGDLGALEHLVAAFGQADVSQELAVAVCRWGGRGGGGGAMHE